MGILDRAKKFVSGKGMAEVRITVIERQPVESARFPVTDSVLKGTMVIDAKEDCTLLATKYEIWLEVEAGPDSVFELVACDKDPDPDTSYSDECLQMPCELSEGQRIEQQWMVSDIQLAKYLAKGGIDNPKDAVDNAAVFLKVKCIADVKGSPFDPCAEVHIDLAPPSEST